MNDTPAQRIRRHAAVAAMLTALAVAGRADQVVMVGGRTLEGIITAETPTHIVVELGVGSMRIPRSKVVRIERSAREEQADLQDAWRRKYFLYRKHVPEELQPVADGYRQLLGTRETAVAALAAMRAREREVQGIMDDAERVRARLHEVSVELQAAVPDQDVAAYNALVARNNALQAELMQRRDALEKLEQARAADQEKVAAYLGAFDEFEAVLDAREKQYQAGARDAVRDRFFEGLREKLAGIRGEVNESAVPTQSAEGSTLVAALINGRQRGTFIVDTGAVMVTITEAFAARLGIDIASLPMAPVVMADGSPVRARAVILQSVKLGEAVVDGVPAVVLPSATKPGVDGLLGMSFLRNFVMRLDGATGKLILRDLKTGQ